MLQILAGIWKFRRFLNWKVLTLLDHKYLVNFLGQEIKWLRKGSYMSSPSEKICQVLSVKSVQSMGQLYRLMTLHTEVLQLCVGMESRNLPAIAC